MVRRLEVVELYIFTKQFEAIGEQIPPLKNLFRFGGSLSRLGGRARGMSFIS
jgi:hypothetical protein